jgi:hypothetical protein
VLNHRHLTVGAVTTDLLRAVEVGVHAGVELVEHVASVRTSGLGGIGVANLARVVGAGQSGALVGAEGVALAAVLVGVDAGIGLVAEAGVVGAAGVGVVAASQAGASVVATSEAGASVVAASQAGAGGAVATSQTRAGGAVAASEAGAGGVGVGRAVLASTNTSSTGGVTSSAIAVRVDAGIGLVGEVGVVRASGVRANVGAGVGAGVRSTVAASQTRAGGAVASSQAGASGVSVGRAILASTDTASASSVASSAVAVRVDTGVGLVSKLGVVRTAGVAVVVGVAASEAGTGVSVTAVSQAGT